MLFMDRVKALITAGGVGPITVGAAADSFQNFADAGVPDATPFHYVIIDPAAGAAEIGAGVYDTVTHQITRTPSWSTDANAAIDVTAGATISITVTAADFDSFASGGGGGSSPFGGGMLPCHSDLAGVRYYPGQGRNIGSGNNTPIANRLYMVPFVAQLRIDAVSLFLSAPQVGTLARAGIWAVDPDTGFPGALVYDLGEQSLAGGGHNFVLPAAARMAEPFFCGFIHDGVGGNPIASSTTSNIAGVVGTIWGTDNLNGAVAPLANGYIYDMAYGALPDPFPAAGFFYATVNLGLYVRSG